MNDPRELTAKHLRVDLPVDSLVPNQENPNTMSDAMFNMLYDNIEQMGVVEPILVRPLEEGKYRVVGGHHRLEVAKLLDFEEVPCMVIQNPDFDDDMEAFQLVRMNVIHGEIGPEKFLKMYERLSEEYSDQVLQDSFGFADEEEFRKLIHQTAQALPPEVQQTFKEAAAEINTIDGLSKLLHEMFSMHGDSLPYGYMIFDFGGQQSIWLRMNNAVRKKMLNLGDFCRSNNRVMDEVVGEIFNRFLGNEDEMTAVKEKTQERNIPEGVETPTLDFLDQYSE